MYLFMGIYSAPHEDKMGHKVSLCEEYHAESEPPMKKVQKLLSSISILLQECPRP